MLSYISVRNFAILENVEVHFESGLTALTGETGAGKSLLIDAIGLLLGDRASNDIIRTGESYCEVSGIFTSLSEKVLSVIKSLDINIDNKEIIITRRIHSNSSNVIKVNRQTITLQDLKHIALNLADIHSQHDTKRLINPDSYLTLIDHFDQSTKDLTNVYHQKKETYERSLKDYLKLLNQKNELREKNEYYRYQIDEIDKHQVKIGEEETINLEIIRLKNYDKIYHSLNDGLKLLQESNASESIYEAVKQLDIITNYDPLYQDLKSRLESTYYELDDIIEVLSNNHQKLDFSPKILDELETRQHVLMTLKRKYSRTIEDILAYRESLAKEINSFENYDHILMLKKEDLDNTYDDLLKQSLNLRKHRKYIAGIIEKELIDALKDLELPQTQFKIVFDEVIPNDVLTSSAFKNEGIDTIDFHLSTNIGETLKPLNKVASGGELSRIMLALKTILIKNLDLSLMIFDEIDSGVSGFVASSVALKMKAIALNTQVITITHVPQIAAKADHHYHIYKSAEADRTKAFVKVLSQTDRIQEIAKMISSKEVTEHALKSAEALLK